MAALTIPAAVTTTAVAAEASSGLFSYFHCVETEIVCYLPDVVAMMDVITDVDAAACSEATTVPVNG